MAAIQSKIYNGEYLNRVAFPLGGMGAGMFCLEGNGAFSHFSIRNYPDVYNEPMIFSAIAVKSSSGEIAKVLEGLLLPRKIFGAGGTGNGGHGLNIGLPRFTGADFSWQFPFAKIRLTDEHMPLVTEITGWSPFIPNDADNSSLPFAAIEFKFSNPCNETIAAQYSFNVKNPVDQKKADAPAEIRPTTNGFVCRQPGTAAEPWLESSFMAVIDDPEVQIDCRWFRGGWFDPLTMLWNKIQQRKLVTQAPYDDEHGSSSGVSLALDFVLQPGESKTVKLSLQWYSPSSKLRLNRAEDNCDSSCSCPLTDEELLTAERYSPWYAGKFANVEAVAEYAKANYNRLREATATFRDCFYRSTLPEEVLEAVAANLTILKSPTVLRQQDGKFWAWEGCCDATGCCSGTCTHVWNYAQALPHLFPELERGLRETEFLVCQDERGHQSFRAPVPIGEPKHDFHAAADGQLGGIMKLYREWRISGDDEWLKRLLPAMRQSLDYCIKTWDPDHLGVLIEPHHNTYDIEFWGADGMCTSFYLGALKAATLMLDHYGESCPLYHELLQCGTEYMKTKLYNGEYFIQKIQWHGLRAEDPTAIVSIAQTNYSPEAVEMLEHEGPKYQYGTGCLSDGVLGALIAEMSGIEVDFIDREQLTSHLMAVHKYNLRHDLSDHSNPQRGTYATGKEGGLLLCTWPKGGDLSLPFVYSNEVWTGIEYQVASHLAIIGAPDKALDIVREARKRYDGRVRNPFDEYECGHWYARALASYGLLQGFSGIRYDAVDKILFIQPIIKGDFSAFFSTASGYGIAGVKNDEPFVEMAVGELDIKEIVYHKVTKP